MVLTFEETQIVAVIVVCVEQNRNLQGAFSAPRIVE
ncbi:uncharacterized protein G2W53_030177 [Senna tora]|uniref:Uncharacterized protein n=1 Tax=Senna tora TaxID=362788 RepID=A0A834T6T7_9FABA|nr:uncharacterized protein G2W53_030177 [Senna tora]